MFLSSWFLLKPTHNGNWANFSKRGIGALHKTIGVFLKILCHHSRASLIENLTEYFRIIGSTKQFNCHFKIITVRLFQSPICHINGSRSIVLSNPASMIYHKVILTFSGNQHFKVFQIDLFDAVQIIVGGRWLKARPLVNRKNPKRCNLHLVWNPLNLRQQLLLSILTQTRLLIIC